MTQTKRRKLRDIVPASEKYNPTVKKAMKVVDSLLSLFKNADGTPIVFTNTQKRIIYAITLKLHNRVGVIAPTQYGKLISDDTPVLTTAGWKNHGDLKVGDRVYNHNGIPVKVERVFPKQTANRMVIFSNGETIKCHAKHEWVGYKKYDLKCLRKMRKVMGMRTVETDDLKKIDFFSLPEIHPIEFAPIQSLPLDSYFFGAWLGDGTKCKPAITGCKEDRAIIDNIPYVANKIFTHEKTGVLTYYFSHQGIAEKLRELRVFNNKHIPDVYKKSSIEDRMKLIAGLIDTDGHVSDQVRKDGNRDGRIYITNANKILIDDIVEVLRSLGIQKISVVCQSPVKSSSGVQGKKDIYIIGFEPRIDFPTQLSRKKIIVKNKKKRVRVKDVIDINPVSGNCIQVEGGIYLVGRSLLPTHNSTSIAIAIIIRCMLKPEKFVIIGGTKAKAAIIMKYVISHLFDHRGITSQIEIEGGSLEKLKRERSKEHITFKSGGSVHIISAENRNRKRIGEMLLGEGGDNIIIDDSVLMDDDTYAYAKRMVGGRENGFILESANPLKRNHFFRSMTKDPLYHKIWIDWQEAVKEGRYTRAYIEEMRKERFFDVFYECKFPTSDMIDDKGYMRLLSDDEVDAAVYMEDGKVCPVPFNLDVKDKKLGVDVAEGGNNTVFLIRQGKTAFVDKSMKTPNVMEIPGIVIEYMREKKFSAGDVFIDGTGVGAGVSARLIEQNYLINNITWGGKASTASKDNAKNTGLPAFTNLRAECYWNLREWVKHGGKFGYNANLIDQLKGIKYRTNSSGNIQVQPKDEMVIAGCDSPDEADALAETFAPTDIFTVTSDYVETNSSFEDLGLSMSDMNAFNMRDFNK